MAENILLTSEDLSVPVNELGTSWDSGDASATIILPAYNEAAALPNVLNDLYQIITPGVEVIVIDDGSTDTTAEIANQYPCRLIRHTENCGKGAAVRTGLEQAQGKRIVVMDADNTYPASAVPKLINLLENYDLVRCIRQTRPENMPRTNLFGNWIFDRLMMDILRLDGKDQLSGLYGLQRQHLVQMNLEAERFDLEAEINMKAKAHKLRVATFPIEYQNRLGEKKLAPFRDGWHILRRILFLFLVHNPVVMFILPGLIISSLGLLGAAVLRSSAIVTPYFGLDVHSFILASLSILSGFQLATFGLAAAMYSVEAGYPPRAWMIWFSSFPVRMCTGLAGVVMAVMGLERITGLVLGWLGSSAGPFNQTQALVSAVTLMVAGMQLLSTALFVSIFAGRFQKRAARVTLERSGELR